MTSETSGVGERQGVRTDPTTVSGPARLDDLDYRILERLVENARSSNRAIARELGIAAGTLADRLARLEREGVITGYSATLDPRALGRTLPFVIGLEIRQGQSLHEVLDRLASLPEVEHVFVVTGRWDLLVMGRVKDPDDLNRLLTDELWQWPLFQHSETMLVIDSRTHAPTEVRP